MQTSCNIITIASAIFFFKWDVSFLFRRISVVVQRFNAHFCTSSVKDDQLLLPLSGYQALHMPMVKIDPLDFGIWELEVDNWKLKIKKTSAKYIALPASLPSGLNKILETAEDVLTEVVGTRKRRFSLRRRCNASVAPETQHGCHWLSTDLYRTSAPTAGNCLSIQSSPGQFSLRKSSAGMRALIR